MRRLILTCLSAIVALLAIAPAASADHHLIVISEFYPGQAAVADDAFLELQMYSSGQNQTGNEIVQIFPNGADPAHPNYQFNPMVNPPNGENQRTILAAGSAVSPRDYTEDFEVNIDPAGGAICFVSNGGFGVVDCVEWGGGNTNVNAGTQVAPAGIPEGQSITRSIAPGCSTFLEVTDDTNDSANDFSLTAPSPRANSVTPTETACASPPPSGGGTVTPAPLTGQRAAALKKCKKKRTAKARKKCRKKAKLLPL